MMLRKTYIGCLEKRQSTGEIQSFEAFADYYFAEYYPQIREIRVECPDEKSLTESSRKKQSTAPDFIVTDPGTAIEIKRVIEQDEAEKSDATSKNLKRLQEALNRIARRKAKDGNLRGRYFISYPYHLRIREGEEDAIAERIVKGLEEKHNSIDVEIRGRKKQLIRLTFKVRFRSPADQFEVILGFAHSLGAAVLINSSEIYEQLLNHLIRKANKQLGAAKQCEKRILLLVNRSFFGYGPQELIEALSLGIEDLLREYEHIDEIWLQGQSPAGEYVHFLLVNRDFLLSLDRGKFIDSPEDPVSLKNQFSLLESWVHLLSMHTDAYKEKVFRVIKDLFSDKRPWELFENATSRESIVDIGDWLATKGRYADAAWIVELCIDDPDPPEPRGCAGNGRLEYDRIIRQGDDPRVVSTVKGRLAWVVKKLCSERNYILKSFEYTKKLLSYENLYVKQQAIVPLVEIAAHRKWIEESSQEKYKEFHDACFGLLRNYSKYPAIARRLVDVFCHFTDLTTDEALDVLDHLQIVDESAPLFVYFSIFRERHYKNQYGEDKKGFSSLPIRHRLIAIIQGNSRFHANLRVQIAKEFRNLLRKHPDELMSVAPFIELLVDRPYEPQALGYLLQVINENVERNPDMCITWFLKIIDKVLDYATKNESHGISTTLRLEQIIEYLASTKPKVLLELVDKLEILWAKGVYIVNLGLIFESYRLVRDIPQREELKLRLRNAYMEMKALNPHLIDMDWD